MALSAWKKRLVALLAILALAALGLYFFLPKEDLAAYAVRRVLLAQGVSQAEFSISRIDSEAFVFENISLQGEVPFSADRLEIGYTLRGLLYDERIDRLSLSNARAKAKSASVEVAAAVFVGKGRVLGALWSGDWTVSGLRSGGAGEAVPPVAGNGTFVVFKDGAEADGTFSSGDKAYRMAFRSVFDAKSPEKSVLTVESASMPWNGGTLAVRDVKVPLGGDAAIPVDLSVRRVSADALFQKMLGGKASATGDISGVLPVLLDRKGGFAVRQGLLKSEGSGVIRLSPDAVPGDNLQVAMLRDALADFRYTALSVQADGGSDKPLSARLNLEGRNPKVQNGRLFKISINLTGDVLDFIKQNLLWLTNPKEILEQGNDAQN
ncbi:MAG: YdbH domain-containing protein [Alphaproteobacteria bacterium]|nr:YdbH domain-containing protein [Alphaproteobacteria bacterium]